MQPFTYLIVNFLAVIFSFIFSFHPKIRFNHHFGAVLKAMLIVMIPFLVWDIWFTDIGVWWFNDRYLIGFRIFDLPIEEFIFFFCIPFSCLFAYYYLDLIFELDWPYYKEKILVVTSIVLALLFAALFHDKIYTWFTLLSTALSLAFLFFVLKVRWIGKMSFAYTVLMVGFFAITGVLTGTGLDEAVVNHNPDHFLSEFRMITVPIEDAVYGYELMLWNVFFFLKFKKK